MFFKETILMAVCSLLHNGRFCPTLKSTALSHSQNRHALCSNKFPALFVSFNKNRVFGDVMLFMVTDFPRFCLFQSESSNVFPSF